MSDEDNVYSEFNACKYRDSCRFSRNELEEANSVHAAMEKELAGLYRRLDGYLWVSVDTRLPDRKQVVLTIGAFEDPLTATYCDTEDHWTTCEGEEWVAGITHWMPIPKHNREKS